MSRTFLLCQLEELLHDCINIHMWLCRLWFLSVSNSAAFPSIPRETSSHLRHLLLGLLQRNHRERMNFGQWTGVYNHTLDFTTLVRNHKLRHCNLKEIIIIKWLWSILDEFFHHPFLEASASMKKCKFVIYIILFMHICCSFGYSKISVYSLNS